METDNKELYKFVYDPKYRNKIINKIHKEQDHLYHQRIRKLESEHKKLTNQRNQELIRVQNSRWEKIVDGNVLINRTEGKIRINQTETIFSSIKGANLNLQTSARVITEEISNTKSKKHASLGGAVVGGMIAGPVGAVAGGVGLGKTKTKGTAKTVANQIPTCVHLGVVVNIDGFFTEIVYISNQVDQSSSTFLSAQNKAQNLISQLSAISKMPVPQHFLRANEEDSVKRYDVLIQQKQYELQKAIEDTPTYAIPQIYRSEEHRDKTDEEYLAYLRETDSIRQVQINQNNGNNRIKSNTGSNLSESSGLGIAAFVLGILGVLFSCVLLGILPASVGLILGIIALCEAKSKKTFAIIGVILSSMGIVIFAVVFVLIIMGNSEDNMNDDYESESIIEMSTEERLSLMESEDFTEQSIDEPIVQSTNEYTESTAVLEDIDTLTEEEYKSMCEELWHNDIFFSEDNLTGKYVKLDLFVKESQIYDATSWQIDDVKEFADLYDIKREFFYCGVNHEGEISAYMGGNLRLYFTNEYNLEPDDINPGDHIIVWGQIVKYGKDNYSGYNICYLIPKYIDNNG